MDDTPDNDVEDLKTDIEILFGRINELENFLKERRLPAIDDRLADLQNLEERVEALEQTTKEQEHRLEMLHGLEESEQSTPAKRVADLREVMIRRAKNRDNERIALHYQEVLDALADIGHEGIHKPDAYQAMEDATNVDGFEMGTVTKDGRDVKAIRLDYAETPLQTGSNEITTGNTEATAAASQD